MEELSRTRTRFSGDLPSHADVVVVGGGIAGTSAAYHTARSGVDVLLVDRGLIGGGATLSAVGVLSPPMRQPFHETVHFRGEEAAAEIWRFALRSVAGLGALLEERGEAASAGLDLSGGYVVAEAHTAHQVERSHKALEAAGFPVEWLTGVEMRRITGGRAFHGGYRLDGGGCIDPGPTAVALARAAREAGAAVREEVDVVSVFRADGRLMCETDQGDVSCEMVVYATHIDSRRFSAFLGDEIVPIRGQGMMSEAGLKRFPGSFASHWKLNVWRSTEEGRIVLGGWRHDAWDRSYWKMRPEVDEPLQESIQTWFEGAFPDLAPLPVAKRWSGIFGWTADYLPLVGALPGRTGELVISGFSGGGLPFAFEAGRVIASMISEGDPVPGAELLDPRRFA
ncbi:MAG: NAD(P)/FAD-dependent oxidoreductase [Gemmatimonadota bacterium]